MDKNLIKCRKRLDIIYKNGVLTGDWELLILIQNLFDACISLEKRVKKLEDSR